MTGGTGFDGIRNHGPVALRCQWCLVREGGGACLDGLGIKFETLFLVGEELLNILALISLELNHLPHLRVDDDGAIASCLALAYVLYGT
jgi:hypothetical protein